MFMKQYFLVLLVALVTVWFPLAGYSQGDLAPLCLFITGSGSITPFQNGQQLNAGQSYDMTAIPDAGFTFDSWQQVVVTVATLTNYTASGDPILPPLTSETDSAEDNYVNTSTLTFTMQDMQVVSAGSNFSITQDQGWQANFLPVPEPSSTSLFAAGLAPVTISIWHRFRRRRPCRQTPC
jgi:hypothetical protein